MNYYLDTEFDGFGGPLLSLALVREDGASLYLIYQGHAAQQPWVRENVLPIMRAVPLPVSAVNCHHHGGAYRIAEFLHGDPSPHINTDWPDDVRYFCQAIITAPGQMVAIPHLSFEIHRVDSYPTTLDGAIQHNAWWDAMALRHILARPDNKDGGANE
ncbi:hypothetical protein LMG26858_04393 [Achromobacter anxifer]|uniref:Uncharacterized protein n=1 Tax=Achromobacter anxifer TaxID=1287737 RepID=A0A6S7EB39_9BURK|nr:hypothetical protein [Achromobacter anxifer]CAB3904204.1 hypothetical protein LMG26858_04393 [Achromobacter anxifer]CAB5512018.1 hypothetical protein LMG26857_01307 [Achromobacter anxifer]